MGEIEGGSRKRKKTSMLPQRKEAKRPTMSSSAARKRKAVLEKAQSDMHSTEDDKTESEMEL